MYSRANIALWGTRNAPKLFYLCGRDFAYLPNADNPVAAINVGFRVTRTCGLFYEYTP